MAKRVRQATTVISEEQYEGISKLGDLFWFEAGPVDQTWDVARSILEKHGFDPKLIPTQHARRVFRRALKSSVVEISRQTGTRAIVRTAAETIEYIRRQVTLETISDKKRAEVINYRRQMSATFDKGTEEISFEFDKGFPEAEFRTTYTKWEDRYRGRINPKTILGMAINVSRMWNSVPVRRHGGVWFAPESFSAEVKQMKLVFADFGNGCKFYSHPVVDTARWRKDASELVNRELMGEIDHLGNDLKKLMEDAASDGEVSERALEGKLKVFKRVLDRAEPYETLLNYRAKAVRDGVKSLQDSIRKLMMGEMEGIAVKKGNGKIKEEAA